VVVIGGEINPVQLSISGSLCEEMMRGLRVNKAFLSIGGISPANGISDYDIQEASMSRIFARSASEVIVLADHSKIGAEAFVRILPFSEVDVVVSDHEMPTEWFNELEEHGVTWMVAE